jgi:hypothetical protein
MIITSLTSTCYHIILDETDLENNKISLNELISNPKLTNKNICKLLKNTLSSPISYFNIFTYNFKIFYIEVFFQ